MTKAQKDLDRLRQNPCHVRYTELVTILARFGFERKQDSTSHVRFRYKHHILVVPKRKPFLKPVYVTQVLKMLDQILDEDPDSER